MTPIVSTRCVESEQVVHHMNGGAVSNYGTLCGVSIDDDQFELIESLPGQKVTCKHCATIWVEARRYRASDIASVLI